MCMEGDVMGHRDFLRNEDLNGPRDRSFGFVLAAVFCVVGTTLGRLPHASMLRPRASGEKRPSQFEGKPDK